MNAAKIKRYYHLLNYHKRMGHDLFRNEFAIEEKREFRRALREDKSPEVKVFCSDFEYGSWYHLYDIPFDGTKEELLEELWQNAPRYEHCTYDCSGQVFTEWFKVAHVRNNVYRVLEKIARDI